MEEGRRSIHTLCIICVVGRSSTQGIYQTTGKRDSTFLWRDVEIRSKKDDDDYVEGKKERGK